MDKRTCSIEGCDKPHLARGWCEMHYRRWRTTGDPLASVPQQVAPPYAPDATCSASECGKRPIGLGYCGTHYARLKRHGSASVTAQSAPYAADAMCLVDGCTKRPRARGYCWRHRNNLLHHGNPLARKERSLGDRLAEIGWDVTDSGCWEWRGPRNKGGYGCFSAKLLGFVNARAHRVVYEHLAGSIPDGLILRHSCDNPPCVNPAHLIPGTMADNSRDMVERGRQRKRGDMCVNGHDVTKPGATRDRVRAGRTESVCIECEREHNHRQRMKLKRAS